MFETFSYFSLEITSRIQNIKAINTPYRKDFKIVFDYWRYMNTKFGHRKQKARKCELLEIKTMIMHERKKTATKTL